LFETDVNQQFESLPVVGSVFPEVKRRVKAQRDRRESGSVLPRQLLVVAHHQYAGHPQNRGFNLWDLQSVEISTISKDHLVYGRKNY